MYRYGDSSRNSQPREGICPRWLSKLKEVWIYRNTMVRKAMNHIGIAGLGDTNVNIVTDFRTEIYSEQYRIWNQRA